MKPPFVHRMTDGSGNVLVLSVMPRTRFDTVGVQTGIRVETIHRDDQGETTVAGTVGLSDDDLDRLIVALQEERLRLA